MIDPKKIEQIARQVHESMPKGIRDFGEDIEKKIRQVLQSQLTRLDLVNREEFDVQTQVLLRTREKMALLEQRLEALEGRQPTPAAPAIITDPVTTPITGSASAPASAPASTVTPPVSTTPPEAQ
ncbi:accessory factor UbiK family protein [Nissabacter sp. SGAir0207]|uniref:ubiquinone biosynthesis accessory factor UbiK n=1 Tax=Nissabacter sp. SGAir0207 TaxID=2126321 RepID=UPI0010CD2F42|nr:accessory factor UbiK family protein [Nissabacter sp. SGAir0207]QCR35014.1 hypothetical protein C1N62_02400 [Nissabacter sp. SGAir0207]